MGDFRHQEPELCSFEYFQKLQVCKLEHHRFMIFQNYVANTCFTPKKYSMHHYWCKIAWLTVPDVEKNFIQNTMLCVKLLRTKLRICRVSKNTFLLNFIKKPFLQFPDFWNPMTFEIFFDIRIVLSKKFYVDNGASNIFLAYKHVFLT